MGAVSSLSPLWPQSRCLISTRPCRWKESGEQYDDRVVEVVWDSNRQTWRMLRFRDDKRDGNYKSVVASIIRSIEHGVEADAVCQAILSST